MTHCERRTNYESHPTATLDPSHAPSKAPGIAETPRAFRLLRAESRAAGSGRQQRRPEAGRRLIGSLAQTYLNMCMYIYIYIFVDVHIFIFILDIYIYMYRYVCNRMHVSTCKLMFWHVLCIQKRKCMDAVKNVYT